VENVIGFVTAFTRSQRHVLDFMGRGRCSSASGPVTRREPWVARQRLGCRATRQAG